MIQNFESGALDLHDFYFTGDDYRYRFGLDAKRRFINVLRGRFNSGVNFNGRVTKWDTVIQEKTSELGRCLNGRIRIVDFSQPAPILEMTDSRVVREAIPNLAQSEASKQGIGKSTLYYMRRNAQDYRSFKLYSKTYGKLQI